MTEFVQSEGKEGDGDKDQRTNETSRRERRGDHHAGSAEEDDEAGSEAVT